MPQQSASTAYVALVTGASRGIGRVIAMQLAERGVRIALHYRNNREAAEATLADLKGTGHSLVDADLADAAGTTDLWQRVVKQYDAVDILINNAGVYVMHAPLA